MDPGMTMQPPASGGAGENMSSSGMNMNMNMDMHMVFYWGKRVELLFSGWSSQTIPQYLLSLAALFVLAFFYQALSYTRTVFFDDGHRGGNNGKGLVMFGRKPMVTSILETAAFAVNAATGYILMLAVMSYNVGVFLVILAGLSVGFFIFCARKKSVAAETPQQSVHGVVAA